MLLLVVWPMKVGGPQCRLPGAVEGSFVDSYGVGGLGAVETEACEVQVSLCVEGQGRVAACVVLPACKVLYPWNQSG